jgi:nitroreductase
MNPSSDRNRVASDNDIKPPSLAEYPRTSNGAERLRFALQFAVLAPSSHNTQPWTFIIRDGSVDIMADRSRALPVVDASGRELIISCGVVLHHLSTALRALGESATAELLPDDADPDLMGSITLGGPAEPSIEHRRWLNAMCVRRTVRFAFQPRVPLDTTLAAVSQACRQEGAELVILTPSQRALMANLITEGDRAQLSSAEFRSELAHWLRPNSTHAHDGIPGYAEGLSDPASLLGPFVVRTFDLGRSRAAKDLDLVEHSPVLGVVATSDDRVRSWLEAGAALSALLLEATSLGLAASFLNQPIEVARLRPRVAELIGGATPQLVLRLGHYSGAALRPTPRRSLEDMLG